VLNTVKGARVHSPGAGEMVVGNGRVRACVVDRSNLDSLLSEAAEREGAKIECGARVTRNGLRARTVVGADGAGSGVASWFGFPKISEFAVCMQADYSCARVSEKDRLDMFLSNARFPGFFGWMIPVSSDCLRVGMGAFADFSSGGAPNVKALFDDFVSRKPVRDAIEGAKKENALAGSIPLKPRAGTAKENVLLVGDAAGHVKATTGGGVVFGAEGARIAARCIAGGRIRGYEGEWKAALGRDLALHWRARAFLNSLPDARMDSLFSMAKRLGAEAFLEKFGDMDRPARMEEKLSEGGFGALGLACARLLAGAEKAA